MKPNIKVSIKKKASMALAATICFSTLAFGGGAAGAVSVNDFTDIGGVQWAKSSIEDVTKQGLFNGTSATTFSPNGSMTRGMFATVLSRLSYDDASSFPSAGFTDVEKGSWYEAGVNWAAAKGIVNGVGNNRFSPNTPVTREQAAVILYNFMKMENISIADSEENLRGLTFTDSSSISDWAKDAVEFVRVKSLFAEGKLYYLADCKSLETNFNPRSNMTRIDAAKAFSTVGQLYSRQVGNKIGDNGLPLGYKASASLWDTHTKSTYTDGVTYTSEYVSILTKNAEEMRSRIEAIVPDFFQGGSSNLTQDEKNRLNYDSLIAGPGYGYSGVTGVYEKALTLNFQLTHDDIPVEHVKLIPEVEVKGDDGKYVWVTAGEYIYDESSNLSDGKGSLTLTFPYYLTIEDSEYFDHVRITVKDCYDTDKNWALTKDDSISNLSKKCWFKDSLYSYDY